MTGGPQRYYTPEEYLALEATTEIKHEYYHGEIFAIAGASREHNQVSRQLFGELYIQLKKRDCIPYTSDTRVKVQATGLYTYPDLAIACKPLHYDVGGSETLLNPRVLIEVLSPGTMDHDLGFKFKHYRQIPSLQEIFYVSQTEPFVDRYLRQANNEWLLTSATGLEAVVEFSSIGCQVPMRLIYADVEFPTAAT